MIVLKSITMVNICQFSEQTVEFDTGLSAICGRNGSGKSTLLRALGYGLTGMVDGDWGTQKDLQKDGVTEPGYVKVSLANMETGNVITIQRYVSGGSKALPDKLVIPAMSPDNDGLVITKRSNVDSYLADLYGIPCRLLFQIFWLRQSKIDMLLTAPSAIVNQFLQEVFDMRNLEIVRDKLKSTTDTIATGLSGTDAEIAKYSAELDALTPEEELVKGLAYVDEQVADSDKDRENFLAKYGDLADMDKVHRKVVSLRSDVHQQRQTLSNAEHVISLYAEAPKAPETTASYDEMTDALQHAEEKRRKEHLNKLNIESRLKTANSNISVALGNLEKAKERLVCPDKCELCGGEIHDQHAYLKSQCMMLTGFETLEEYEVSISESVAAYKAEVTQLEKELKLSVENSAELDKAIQKLDQDREDLNDVLRWNDMWHQKRACEAALAQMVPELEKLEHLYSKSDEILETKHQLDEQTKLLHEAADKARAEAARIRERRRSLIEQLELLHKRREKEIVNREARKILVELRDGLGSGRVQARYLASKIREINKHLEYFMRFTGMPFSLYLKENTHTFAFSTPDGYEHPTVHLSGAQKNMSAVALQMALFHVINPHINLFLIDEPSEALDDSNKVVLADMFRRMNNMLSAMNGTMLIVSRDEKMIESCETLITVGAQ